MQNLENYMFKMENKKKNSSSSNLLLFIVIIAAGIGLYFLSNKKDDKPDGTNNGCGHMQPGPDAVTNCCSFTRKSPQGEKQDSCGICGGRGPDTSSKCCPHTGKGVNGEEPDACGICGGSVTDKLRCSDEDCVNGGKVMGCDNVCDSGKVLGCDNVCDSGKKFDTCGECAGPGPNTSTNCCR